MSVIPWGRIGAYAALGIIALGLLFKGLYWLEGQLGTLPQ